MIVAGLADDTCEDRRQLGGVEPRLVRHFRGLIDRRLPGLPVVGAMDFVQHVVGIDAIVIQMRHVQMM
jgi:hypothetical protein